MAHARVLALAAAACLLPVTADAKPASAWAAAKASLPKDTQMVVGFDLTQVRKSSLFTMAMPLVLSQQPDLKSGLDLIKQTCSIDPMKSVEAVVVGTAKDSGEGAIFIAVKDLDEARIVGCLEAIANKQALADQKVIVTKQGAITELSMGGDKVYTRWIGKDVLVLPIDVGDKKQLEKWAPVKGAIAKAPVNRGLAKTNTKAAVWAVTAVEQDIEGKKMKLGFGSLTTASGTLDADLHFVVASAADAKAIADKASQELATMATGGQASLQTLLAGVTVSSASDEVLVKATVAEKDLFGALGALMTK